MREAKGRLNVTFFLCLLHKSFVHFSFSVLQVLKFYGLTTLGQKTWPKGIRDGDGSDLSSEEEFADEDPEEEYDLLEIGG